MDLIEIRHRIERLLKLRLVSPLRDDESDELAALYKMENEAPQQHRDASEDD